MDIREGMRRLGLAAGIVGAIAGAFVSYNDSKPLLAQREQHRRFASLVSSRVVAEQAEQLNQAYRRTGHYPGPWIHHPETHTFTSNAEDVCDPDEGWWKVDSNGVKTIYFKGASPEAKNKPCPDLSHATAIETDDGQKILRTDSPAVTAYLVLLVFPVVGFLLPWGILKTLAWIAAGFFPGRPET